MVKSSSIDYATPSALRAVSRRTRANDVERERARNVIVCSKGNEMQHSEVYDRMDGYKERICLKTGQTRA